MPDEDATDDPPLYEPFAVAEIFLDGFSMPHIEAGTFRCTAFSIQPVPGDKGHQPTAVVRLIMPVATARHFASQITGALTDALANDRRKDGEQSH